MKPRSKARRADNQSGDVQAGVFKKQAVDFKTGEQEQSERDAGDGVIEIGVIVESVDEPKGQRVQQGIEICVERGGGDVVPQTPRRQRVSVVIVVIHKIPQDFVFKSDA